MIDVLCAIAIGVSLVWAGHDVGFRRGQRDERRHWSARARERMAERYRR